MAQVRAHQAALEADGYCIVPEAVAPQLCDDLLAEIGRMADVWDRSLVQGFHGYETIRYFDLLNAAAIFQQIPVQSVLLRTAQAVLGEDCLLGTYGTVSIGPGERPQQIHADDGIYGLRRPHPNIYLNAVIALSDFTEENGATRVVPGSHRWPKYPAFHAGAAAPDCETVPAVMRKGSACLVLGATWHGGGANRTDRYRHGVTLAYCAGWVRPQENFLVAVSQDKAATFEPELQALLGYRVNRNRLGHIFTSPEHFSGPLAHRLRRKPDQPILT